MKNRFLGIALIVLTALGMLNLYQAVRAHVGPSHAGVEVFEAPIPPLPVIKSLPPIPPLPPIPAVAPSAPIVHASYSRGDGDVMIDKEFSVSQGGTLLVDVQHSDLVIETGNFSKARIVVTLDSPNMDRARERFEKMDFRTGQSGDQIALRSETPRSSNWWGRMNTRMNIKVHVRIPQEFNLDLQSTHGDVEIGDLSGNVKMNTTHGDVTAKDIRGERILFKTTHGEVKAGSFVGRLVEVKSTHGDISVQLVESERFSASTTHSDIEVASLSGDASLKTTHGDVMLGLVKEHALDVRTTHGDVALRMPNGFGADVDLRGEQVRMPDSVDLNGRVERKSIVGRINGGGPRMEVSTTHGSVTVQTR